MLRRSVVIEGDLVALKIDQRVMIIYGCQNLNDEG